MSEHLPKLSLIQGIGISVAGTLIPTMAPSQAKAKTETTPPRTIGGVALPDPNAINKKIQKDYPAELFDDPHHTQKGITLNGANTTNSVTTPVVHAGSGHTTSVGSSNYTFVLSTPLLIAIVAIVGGIALFPVVHLFLNSKKIGSTDPAMLNQ